MMQILNQDIILNRLQEQKQNLAKYSVSKIGLFGSFAKNKQTEKSDIDFIVEYEKGKKNYDNFINVLFLLENTFDRNIELVTKESLSEGFLTNIESNIKYVHIHN